MAFDRFQPWRQFAMFQVELFGQLDARAAFEDIQHGLRVHALIGKLIITRRLVLNIQTIRRNRVPKARIVHGLQPVFNIFNGFECFHASKLARPDSNNQVNSLGGIPYAV